MDVKQVTRGHNIVADGWAGAANPYSHPTLHPIPFPTQTLTQTAPKSSFSPFSTCADGPTDRRTKPLIELRVRN